MNLRKILSIALASTFAFAAVGMAKSHAGKGPAEKATGSVSLYEPYDGGHREVDFNAHEAMENRPAKGKMTDKVYDANGNWRREFHYDVEYVRVDGDYAHFGALCTADSEDQQTGKWLYVKVHDGGTPGRNGDHIGWKWGTESEVDNWVENGSPTDWWRMPIEGNLVVHSHDSEE